MIPTSALIWALPSLPLLGLLLIGLIRVLHPGTSDFREKWVARTALIILGLSLLSVMLLNLSALLNGLPGPTPLTPWFESGGLLITIGANLDAIALTMVNIVALVALIIARFSVNYLHREAGFDRFFAVLMLFVAGMQIITLAGNAILMFVGWELVGVSSYLLIAYNASRTQSTKNATRAFVTNRIGDAGFLLGIFFMLLWLGSSQWQDLNNMAIGLGTTQRDLIALAFILPALIKSAQFPFSAWITRALEGPTPSSAIFYGAVMIHAGVILLLRIEPLLAHTPAMLVLVGVVGLFSVAYGWLVGLTQTDVKSALIFPTIAQVGLMLIWISLGWTTLALAHLASHAIWRTWQFLNAPALMHQVSRPARPVPAWMQQQRFWFTAALQRFWLDPLSNWLIEKPTMAMSRDLDTFDRRILSKWVASPRQIDNRPNQGVGQGSGLFGAAMQWLAEHFERFEHGLILKGGGEGLTRTTQRSGAFFTQIEGLLAQPRYLAALLVLVFIVSV